MRRLPYPIVFPCVLGLALLLPPSTARAGAWLMPEGEGLAITQLSYFTGDSYWDVAGDRQSQDRYSKGEIQPYVEYGLTRHVTVGGSAYLQRADQTDENSGIADPELFARVKLWQRGRHLVSLQPLVKLPSIFEHDDGVPRGGSQSTDLELSLLYGTNLHWLSPRDYADIRVGYRHRSRGLNAQYRTDLALGLSPAPNWQIIPALRTINARTIETTPFAQTGDLDYDLVKAEVTVAYQLGGGRWVQATVFDHLAGAQTGDGEGVALGYAVRF